MNYKAIVFIGFNEPLSKKNIKDYFKRHYENAKKENYSLDEFFDGCMDAVKTFEGYFDDMYTKQKFQLEHYLENNANPNSELIIHDDVLKRLQDELKNLKKEDLEISANNHINPYKDYKIKGLITYSELEHWKTTIEDVRLSLQPKKIKKPSNIEPLNFELKQAEVIYLFDILQVAGFIFEPKYHDGSYYRKLEAYFTADKLPIKDAEQKRNKFKQGVPLSSAENIKAKLIDAIKKMPY